MIKDKDKKKRRKGKVSLFCGVGVLGWIKTEEWEERGSFIVVSGDS